MKYLFIACILLLSSQAFSQPDMHFLPFKSGFKIKAYIDGQRLDSVDAQYATISWTNSNEIYFDFGQYRDRRRELMITDENKIPYQLEQWSTAFALNLFYFNGWELYQVTGYSNTYILKKRQM